MQHGARASVTQHLGPELQAAISGFGLHAGFTLASGDGGVEMPPAQLHMHKPLVLWQPVTQAVMDPHPHGFSAYLCVRVGLHELLVEEVGWPVADSSTARQHRPEVNRLACGGAAAIRSCGWCCETAVTKVTSNACGKGG